MAFFPSGEFLVTATIRGRAYTLIVSVRKRKLCAEDIRFILIRIRRTIPNQMCVQIFDFVDNPE